MKLMIKNLHGFNKETKEQIAILYRCRTKTAINILYALRERFSKYITKKFENETDIVNDLYVPGLIIPTRQQINNYIHNTLKPNLGLNEGKNRNKFSYGDLQEWIESNLALPDNDDEPFVLDYYVEYNHLIPSASKIRLSISTQNLLKIATQTIHLCADATYKLTWHNFPVFLRGIKTSN